NEAVAQLPELDDLADDVIRGTLARALAVGAPDRTKRAVLGTAADRLHRRPHVASLGSQVPSGGQKPFGGNAAPVVNALRRSFGAVRQDRLPDVVAVPFHHRMGAAEIV